jgi:hypothetical protein
MMSKVVKNFASAISECRILNVPIEEEIEAWPA